MLLTNAEQGDIILLTSEKTVFGATNLALNDLLSILK